MSKELADMLGLVVFGFAGGMLLLAILGPRIIVRVKRLRRCPKCLYDMSGVTSMKCSECGYVAKCERKFHRGRTRKRWVMLALFVLLPGAHIVQRIPAIEDRGWVAAVPTTVLIVSLPWLEPDLDWAITEYDPDSIFGLPTPPPPPPGRSELLHAELLLQRVEPGTLWRWQQELLIQVCNGQSRNVDPSRWHWDSLRSRVLGTTRWADGRELDWLPYAADSAEIHVVTRRRWPTGEPIVGQFQVRRPRVAAFDACRVQLKPLTSGLVEVEQRTVEQFMLMCGMGLPTFSFWQDGAERLGTIHDDVSQLRYEVTWFQTETALCFYPLERWRYDRSEIVTTPCEVGGTIESTLTPVQSEAFDRELSTFVFWLSTTPAWSGSDGPVVCSAGLNERLTLAMRQLGEGVTFAFRAEVTRGDRVLAITHAWYTTIERHTWPYGDVFKLHDVIEEELARTDAVEPLQLRLVSDPVLALRNPWHDRYWEGEVIVPLTSVGRPIDVRTDPPPTWYPPSWLESENADAVHVLEPEVGP